MTDDETEIVEQEAQEVDQSTESDDQQTERQEEQVQQAPQRRGVEYNWAEARRASQEKDRTIREQQEVINRLSKGTKEDEPQLSTDDILTVGQLQKLQERERQQQSVEFNRQREEILRLKYPDIDQVLSPENIAQFEQMEPELAESLCGLGHDPIKMKAAAYKLIKKTVPRETPPSMEKKKAELNAKKPVSIQSVSKNSAIGNAHLFENGLTPDLMRQMREEMEAAIQNG